MAEYSVRVRILNIEEPKAGFISGEVTDREDRGGRERESLLFFASSTRAGA